MPDLDTRPWNPGESLLLKMRQAVVLPAKVCPLFLILRVSQWPSLHGRERQVRFKCKSATMLQSLISLLEL